MLTRGHMFDPESWHLGAAERRALCGHDGLRGEELHGARSCRWRRYHRDGLGSREAAHRLSFGAKTPAELAIAIVGELVDVRYRQRYSEEAQARHEKSLGRE